MTTQGGLKTAPSYQSRLLAERAVFENQTKIHDLPEIHHYWSNRHLRPKLETFGFSTPDEFLLNALERVLRERSGALRFLSIGAGNCDTEVGFAERLREHGSFVIECVDLNPDMLKRGRSHAESCGVGSYLDFELADLNSWKPERRYDAVIANQSLHHVVNLEDLLAGIRDALLPESPFVISDMIGRNGHLRWPEARAIVNEYWRKLPPSFRFNKALNRFESCFVDSDCSGEGFEGIRSQDILPLLSQTFQFQFFFGFGNVIDAFIDRQFGYNFDPNLAWVRSFIDEVHARDEAEQLAGTITPTHLLAEMRTGSVTSLPAFYPRSPQCSTRDPQREETDQAEPECGYDVRAWAEGSHSALENELNFLSRKLTEMQKKTLELSQWGAVLDQEIVQLQTELAERTVWALDMERQIQDSRSVAALHCERLEAELSSRTEWARSLEQAYEQRTKWAQSLWNQLEVERYAAEHMGVRRIMLALGRRLRFMFSRRR